MKIYDDGKIFGIQVIIPKAIRDKRKIIRNRRDKFVEENYPHAYNIYLIITLFVLIVCDTMGYNHNNAMIVLYCLILGAACLIYYINTKYNKQAEEGFKV